MDETVLCDTDGRGVATVTLNRAHKHNAFDEEIIARLNAVFQTLSGQTGLRCVVLAANGPTFCAGADLNWMRKMAHFSEAENVEDALRLATLFDRLNTMPTPTVAKIQGPAFAGALGMISACDIAIAADHAKFAVTEVRLGLIPAGISPYVLAAIGPRAARRYFETAERFDEAEAKRIGLVHEAVPADALDETVNDIVERILRNAPGALRASKALMRTVVGPITEETRKETAQRLAVIRGSAEAQDGIGAFFEKREPFWRAGGGEA